MNIGENNSNKINLVDEYQFLGYFEYNVAFKWLDEIKWSKNPTTEYDECFKEKNVWHLKSSKISSSNLPDKILINMNMGFVDIISDLTTLKHLIIKNDTTGSDFPDSIFNLTNLETLIISSGNGYKKKFTITKEIKNLKKLKKLVIIDHQIDEIPEEIGYCCDLEILLLIGNKLKKLPDSLKNCKKLKHINISYNSIDVLPFYECYFPELITFHAGYNKLKQLPECLRSCKKLKQLNIISNEISELPFKNGDLPELNLLYIGNNKNLNFKNEIKKFIGSPITSIYANSLDLDSIPEEIARFEDLDHIYLQDNNIMDFSDLACFQKLDNLWIMQNPGSKNADRNKILKLINKFNEVGIDNKTRKLYFSMFLGAKEHGLNASIHDILYALNFPDPIIKNNAFDILYHHIRNPFPLDSASSVLAMIGTVDGFKKTEIEQKLKVHGIKFSKKIDENVTHVIVGKDPKADLEKALKLKDFTWILPQHLKDFFESMETPYLKNQENTEKIKENLQNLLLSKDENNKLIALNMMLEGGMPEGLLYDILILYLTQNKETYQKAKSVFEKYAPEDLVLYIKSFGKKKFYNIMDKIYEGHVIDKIEFLRKVMEYKVPNIYKLPELAIKCGNREIIKSCIKYYLKNGSINLEYFYYEGLPHELIDFQEITEISLCSKKIRQIPSEILQLNNLEIIELYGNFISSIDPGISNLSNLKVLKLGNNKLSSLPKNINLLKSLKEISLTTNKFNQFPVELINMEELEILQLSYNKIIQLPKEIANLKKLKVLNLSNNKLKKFIPELTLLENLEELYLSENNIDELPEDIAKLTKLRQISLPKKFLNEKERLQKLLPAAGIRFW